MQENPKMSNTDTDLKFSREQGFFDKSTVICTLIIIGFILANFAMLHFREVYVEVLEIDSIAPRYIVAQVDFEFRDEEATIILRQEALRDIGKIFKVGEKDIRVQRSEFEKSLVSNQDWRTKLPDSTFDEIYDGTEALAKNLMQLRFTDPRTLQKIKDLDLDNDTYVIYSPSSLNEDVILPDHIWEFIQERALPINDFDPRTIDFIVHNFKIKNWKIEEDIPQQRLLRKKIESSVPEKYTFVSAGNRIIDQGDKVTGRHVAMLQAMKKALSANRNVWNLETLFGSLLLSLVITGVAAAYIRSYHPQLASSNRLLFLVVTIVVLTFGLAKLIEFFLLTSKTNLFEVIGFPLFVPFAAIIVCNLISTSVAITVAGYLTMILTMTLAFNRPDFMIINLIGGMTAILAMRYLRRRKEIFVVCAKVWVICVAGIVAIHFYENTVWQISLLTDIVSTGFFMFFTAILVVGLLPLLESSFQIMTDVTLMEYMDPNFELLQRLTIEAPGSYQHSLVVGSIAESAALSIGANGLFCRVATLYHDIGKMVTSQYFTENQQGAVNIHQLLTPMESAQAIIAHVGEGVALARKAALPEPFIDVIKEHHGNTLVYYFYHKQLEAAGGDKSRVDEKAFRYAGPKPRSKESAIIMISDTIEAASRSLDKIDEESLTVAINRLVREKADDGQFDECLLTFEELSIVKKTIVKTILASGHSRVKYPAPND